ncbi:hypothetical protein HDU92_001336, partial [Lobulomyces angularis]
MEQDFFITSSLPSGLTITKKCKADEVNHSTEIDTPGKLYTQANKKQPQNKNKQKLAASDDSNVSSSYLTVEYVKKKTDTPYDPVTKIYTPSKFKVIREKKIIGNNCEAVTDNSVEVDNKSETSLTKNKNVENTLTEAIPFSTSKHHSEHQSKSSVQFFLKKLEPNEKQLIRTSNSNNKFDDRLKKCFKELSNPELVSTAELIRRRAQKFEEEKQRLRKEVGEKEEQKKQPEEYKRRKEKGDKLQTERDNKKLHRKQSNQKMDDGIKEPNDKQHKEDETLQLGSQIKKEIKFNPGIQRVERLNSNTGIQDDKLQPALQHIKESKFNPGIQRVERLNSNPGIQDDKLQPGSQIKKEIKFNPGIQRVERLNSNPGIQDDKLQLALQHIKESKFNPGIQRVERLNSKSGIQHKEDKLQPALQHIKESKFNPGIQRVERVDLNPGIQHKEDKLQSGLQQKKEIKFNPGIQRVERVDFNPGIQHKDNKLQSGLQQKNESKFKPGIQRVEVISFKSSIQHTEEKMQPGKQHNEEDKLEMSEQHKEKDEVQHRSKQASLKQQKKEDLMQTGAELKKEENKMQTDVKQHNEEDKLQKSKQHKEKESECQNKSLSTSLNLEEVLTIPDSNIFPLAKSQQIKDGVERNFTKNKFDKYPQEEKIKNAKEETSADLRNTQYVNTSGGRGADADSWNRKSPELKTRRFSSQNYYADYWDDDAIAQGIMDGTVFRGILRINKISTQESYCTSKNLNDDVFINGIKNRNRALEGDEVYVAIISGEELEKEKKFTEERNEKKTEIDIRRQKKCDFFDLPSDTLIIDEVAEERRASKYKGTKIKIKNFLDMAYGKVVKIISKIKSREFTGLIGTTYSFEEEDSKPSTARYFWFRPSDKRVPQINVASAYIPKEYVQNPKLLKNLLFRVAIKHWGPSSMCPQGLYRGKLGVMGEIGIETEAALINAGITWDERFPSAVMRCLPKTPWTIPESEVSSRLDLRNLTIFTIDPSSAKDLDDAVHFRHLSDGNYEVGVHIADVSYFIEPGSAIDVEAKFRATTIYLVQKAIPMLPRLLSENLNSLNPGVDRLAFSVIWKLDKAGLIIREPWFGKTIIRSRAKLSYEHAQAFIEGFSSWKEARAAGKQLNEVEISDGVKEEELKKVTLDLYELSVRLRERRFSNGALSLQNIKLWFSLNEEGNPVDCGAYELKEANRLIEEFMLLANISVAKRILLSYKSISLLRQHSPPSATSINNFIVHANNLGFFQFKSGETSSTDLQSAFDSIADDIKQKVLQLLCVKPMQRAKYYCSGDKELEVTDMSHYALNVPYYTHFTSPIRRYCDLMVHRLLYGAIKFKKGRGSGYKFIEGRSIVDDLTFKDEDFLVDPKKDEIKSLYQVENIAEVAKHCNIRKFSSKDVQDASQNLYLCAFLTKNFGGLNGRLDKETKLIEMAVVYKVGNRSFDVLVTKFGIEKRVWVEDLIDRELIKGSDYDQSEGSLKIYWKAFQSEEEKLEMKNNNNNKKEKNVDQQLDSIENISNKFQRLSIDYESSESLVQAEEEDFIQEVKVFDQIPVKVEVNMKGLKIFLYLNHPNDPDNNLNHDINEERD